MNRVLLAGAYSRAALTLYFALTLRLFVQHHQLVDAFAAQRLPYAVAAQEKPVFRQQIAIRVIHDQMLIEADRAFEHMTHVGAIPHVILGEQCHFMVAQPVNSRVADVTDGVAVAAQHQQTQGGRHAGAGFVHRALAHDPAVDGGQHAIHRLRHFPGFGRGVVIREQAAYRVFGGLAPRACARYAIGDGEQRAARGQFISLRRDETDEIFVAFALAGAGGVAYGEFKGHGVAWII